MLQVKAKPNKTQQQPVDYKQLYEHLLSAVSEYFAVDVGDQELIYAYELIARHLTNEPGKVETD